MGDLSPGAGARAEVERLIHDVPIDFACDMARALVPHLGKIAAQKAKSIFAGTHGTEQKARTARQTPQDADARPSALAELFRQARLATNGFSVPRVNNRGRCRGTGSLAYRTAVIGEARLPVPRHDSHADSGVVGCSSASAPAKWTLAN